MTGNISREFIPGEMKVVVLLAVLPDWSNAVMVTLWGPGEKLSVKSDNTPSSASPKNSGERELDYLVRIEHFNSLHKDSK